MTSREWQKIEDEKRIVLDRFMRDTPIQLGALAKELGLTVKLSTLKPGVSGKIYKENNSYTIKINRHETRERQRFTLAHEISHFLLHRDIIDQSEGGIIDNVLYRSGAPEQIEFEANRLAADMLMPRKIVSQKLDALGAPVSEEVIEYMAQIFQVSKAAMEIRLSPLSIQ